MAKLGISKVSKNGESCQHFVAEPFLYGIVFVSLYSAIVPQNLYFLDDETDIFQPLKKRKSNVAASLFLLYFAFVLRHILVLKRDKGSYYFHNSKLFYSIFSRILLNSKYLLNTLFIIY